MTAGHQHGVRQALVVEDDELLGQTLLEALAGYEHARWCRNLGEARACLLKATTDFRPELLVLDVVLPDGTGLELLREIAGRTPFPVVVAISGAAQPEDTFELARLGVTSFIPKPIALETFERALERALTEPIDLRPSLRQVVGKRTIGEVEHEVRATMVVEAMAKAGTVRGAARVLSISRQLLQHILRQLG